MHRQSKLPQPTRKGFTIVEVSIATAFLAVLLIAISIVTSNVINIYNKGNTVKAVDSAGRAIIDDMQSAIQTARFTDSEAQDSQRYYRINFATIDGREVPTHGILCTGSYSYLWNSGYVLGSSSATTNRLQVRYGSSPPISRTNYKLLKFHDTGRTACLNYNNTNLTEVNDDGSPPEELLHNTDVNLAIYNLSVLAAANDSMSAQSLFSVSFVLSVIDADVDITSSGNYCRGDTTDINRCAINRFSFSVKSSGSAL